MQENSLETMPETKNKTFVIVSAILLLSIAVIIAVFFNKNQANKDMDRATDQMVEIQQEEMTTDGQQNEVEGTLLFADLIAQRKGSYLCQIKNEEDSYTYYFDNERMAIEVMVENSHMMTIIDEEFTYNWEVGEKVGTKFSNRDNFVEDDLDQASDVFDEEMMEESPEENLLPAEDIGPFDPANFVCEPWVVEESVFTPPADVMFQDLSQIQEQMIDFAQ